MTTPTIISESWNGSEVTIEAEYEGELIKQTLSAHKPCCLFFDSSVKNYTVFSLPEETQSLAVVGFRGFE
jgi:hypothetical protein